MTDRAFRRRCARRCSSHSCGLTTRAIKTKAAAAGLAIARDIARSQGGDITLGDSPQGGLRAAVRVLPYDEGLLVGYRG